MMRFLKYFTPIIAFFVCCGFAQGAIVQVAQVKNGTPVAVPQPYIVTSGDVNVSVAASVGESIRLTLINPVANTRQVFKKDLVSSSDEFTVGATKHYGAVFNLTSLTEGAYQLVVERGDWSFSASIQQTTSNLVVEFNGPKITGTFFWDSSSGYWATHTDGLLIRSLTEVRSIGFSGVVPSVSGNQRATFTVEYLDGTKQGQKHAVDLAATITPDSKVMIGNGTINSISSTYMPANTNAKMRLTYRVFSKAGLFAEKSQDVYFNNQATQSAPIPHGVFTGTTNKLDGVTAFTGFEPYVENMVLNTNPVRMIYKADKRHYFGGGGSADIYGGFLNGRNTNRLVHTDTKFVYFDVTGSTDGTKISESNYFVRDLTTWRRYSLVHKFQLSNAAKPPVATELAIYRKELGQWFSAPKQLETYVIKDHIPTQKDLITQIRVRAEARPYEQSFSYDFGTGRKGSCIIPIDATECIATANLEYPSDRNGVYHNRHRIIGVPNGRQSDELISIWYYDGAPAFLVPGSVTQDPIKKTVSFQVQKHFVTEAWGKSGIRDVKLFVAHEDRPSERVALPLEKADTVTVSGTDTRSYVYRYNALMEGKYTFYAYIESGYPASADRYKHEEQIMKLSFLDMTPPVIKTNITNEHLHAVQDIQITLQDQSAASVQSVLVTGGDTPTNQAIPFSKSKNNVFSLQFVHLKPSLKTPYTLTVKAQDAAGNLSTKDVAFFYSPLSIAMADTKQPAVASPLRNVDGRPTNVITTPQIKDSDGNLARGVHKVFFTLSDEAASPMVVNGTNVSPGDTIAFSSNLSLTGSRLRFEAYPLNGNEPTESEFQIDIPQIRVTVCPAEFSEVSQSCIYIDIVEATKSCPNNYSLSEDGKLCELLVTYTPTASCKAGYVMDSDTHICKGTIKAGAIQTCPTGYGLNQATGTCQKHDVIKAEPCTAGSMLVDGMCKELDGELSNPSVYCGGHNVSAAPHCDNGICTSYNPTWNACETITPATPDSKCPAGTLSQGLCEFDHQYNLKVSCPFGFNRENFNCTRLEIVEPAKNCAPGWEKSAENCVKLTYAAFTGCPSTHVLMNGRCHLLEDIHITCPESFDWDGAKCSRTVVENASEQCPADHVWNSSTSTCRKTDTQAATPECESGYSWDQTQCKKTLSNPATPVCDIAGYSWNGSACALTETQPGTLQCPDGFAWNDATANCQKIDSANASLECPSTYTWNSTTASCERGTSQPATAECKSGFTLNQNGLCEKTETQPAKTQCSDGFTLSANQCSKTENQPAAPKCNNGYQLSANGTQCELIQTTSSTFKCSDGWTWDGSKCTKYVNDVQPSGWTCPSGNYKAMPWPTGPNQNVCYPVKPLTCPAGYSTDIENDAICYNFTSMAPKSYGVCPSTHPYSFIDNTYVCSNQPNQYWMLRWDDPKTSCPAGYVKDSTYGCRSSTAVTSIGWYYNGGLTYNPVTYKMEGYLKIDREHHCPADYNYIGSGTCQKVSTTAFTLECPSTWTLTGNNCSKVSIESPIEVCDADWSLLSPNCTKLTTEAPSVLACPENWTLQGATCNSVETTSRIYTCAADRTLDGVYCNKTLSTAQVWKCPDGWAGGSMCSRTLTAPADRYECVSDWTLTAQTCSKDVYKAPDRYTCPVDWMQQTDPTVCELYTDVPSTGYVCENGWDLNGNQCSTDETTPETRSCSNGFTQQDINRCYADSPAESIGHCPDATWTVEPTQCQLKNVTDFTLECNEGFSLISKQCHKTTNQPATIECGEGDTSENGKCGALHTTPTTSGCEAPYVAHSGQCRHRVEIDKIEE